MNNLQFRYKSTLVTNNSKLYRPPSFPPPDDWAVSVDENGNDLSLYGGGKWDFSAFGYTGYNFEKQNLDERNLALVKQAMIFILYHPSFYPGSYQSAKTHFQLLIKIATVCSRHKILLNEIYRFPKLFHEVSQSIQCSKTEEYLSYLHKFLAYSDELGFVIADKNMIGYLARNISDQAVIQHPYIPPRILSYQIKRFNECLDDFFAYQTQIISAFEWLSHAYNTNSEIMETTSMEVVFCSPFHKTLVYKNRITYPTGFNGFLKDYGLYELFSKWLLKEKLKSKETFRVSRFGKYFNLIRAVSIFYILNFSLQRRDEACSMRADCFSIENDHKLGPIAILSGETTKTDFDSDARWVVSQKVEKAVKALAIIAKLRLNHAPKSVQDEFKVNPFLLTPSYEPWQPGRNTGNAQKLKYVDFGTLDQIHPSFFDEKELLITEEDAQIALSLTPNLDQKEWFGIGKPWKFSAHQLRRTTCVNMFASNMVSDHSLQFEMKHLSRNMTLYYGRNYTNLRLNSDAETQLIVESYKSIYRQFTEVLENSYEYVRPHSKINVPVEIVNLVSDKEEKQFIDLAKKGEVGSRLTLLGLCLKRGVCEYGGIESVSKCAGGDGGNICSDAIFIRRNKEKLIKLRDAHKSKIEQIEIHSPRYKALTQEIKAIGIYLDVIERKQ